MATPQPLEIDGIAVRNVATPASPEELSEVMREASQAGRSMIPIGGGTHLGLGNVPRSADLALRTERLAGIVEYEPDNMTVSVMAGTPLDALQGVLAGGNQFLPIDPPNPERSTVGGITAASASGPLRFRYGTIRDMLIGVRICHADGTRTRAGGKLVKNVTGYDMCKLYTGSLGTLGVLTELTFKVQPRSESLATLFLAYPALAPALEATQLFLRSSLLPDAVEAWNRPARARIEHAPDAPEPWLLMVRFGEVDAAVRWQVARVEELAASSGARIAGKLGTAESEAFWRRAASAREAEPAPNGRPADELRIKCSVLYRSVVETVARMEEIGARLGGQTSLHCHAGNSIIYGRFLFERAPETARLREAVAELRRAAGSCGGHAVVEKVRPEVKNGWDTWGYEAPALEIMRRIKGEFDPKGLLNPGRYVGGI